MVQKPTSFREMVYDAEYPFPEYRIAQPCSGEKKKRNERGEAIRGKVYIRLSHILREVLRCLGEL